LLTDPKTSIDASHPVRYKKTMDGEQKFYIRYPKHQFIVAVVVASCQFSLLFLLPNNIFIIIWINLAVLFFGYHVLKLLLANIFKCTYFAFNKEGVTIVDTFGRKKKYVWNDYKGYILIDNIIMIQFGRENLKIIAGFLKNGNVNEIIEIIEANKVDVTYHK
jgi:hypothetical protein